MDIDKAIYDNSTTLLITGLSGLFKGCRATVCLGQSFVVGRSRMCDMSVARAEECVKLARQDLESHQSYRKISRQHFRITLTGKTRVEIEDLSTNGTVVNGYRVDRLVIDDFSVTTHKLDVEFGHGELIEVVMGGAVANHGSEALTEQRSLSRLDPDQHLSGVD